jgi:hypothetical protein
MLSRITSFPITEHIWLSLYVDCLDVRVRKSNIIDTLIRDKSSITSALQSAALHLLARNIVGIERVLLIRPNTTEYFRRLLLAAVQWY